MPVPRPEERARRARVRRLGRCNFLRVSDDFNLVPLGARRNYYFRGLVRSQCAFDLAISSSMRIGANCCARIAACASPSKSAANFWKMLIERNPKAVSQKELYDLLWPASVLAGRSIPTIGRAPCG